MEIFLVGYWPDGDCSRENSWNINFPVGSYPKRNFLGENCPVTKRKLNVIEILKIVFQCNSLMFLHAKTVFGNGYGVIHLVRMQTFPKN